MGERKSAGFCVYLTANRLRLRSDNAAPGLSLECACNAKTAGRLPREIAARPLAPRPAPGWTRHRAIKKTRLSATPALTRRISTRIAPKAAWAPWNHMGQSLCRLGQAHDSPMTSKPCRRPIGSCQAQVHHVSVAKTLAQRRLVRVVRQTPRRSSFATPFVVAGHDLAAVRSLLPLRGPLARTHPSCRGDRPRTVDRGDHRRAELLVQQFLQRLAEPRCERLRLEHPGVLRAGQHLHRDRGVPKLSQSLAADTLAPFHDADLSAAMAEHRQPLPHAAARRCG